MRTSATAPSRRRMLRSTGVVGAAALAGCLGSPFGDSCTAGADFSMEAASDADVARTVSSPVKELPPVAKRVITAALAGDGEKTYRGVYEPDVHAEYVARPADSTYHRVRVRAGDHVETTGYRYEVAFGDDVPTPRDRREVLDFTDLPTPDRDAFLGAMGASVEKLRRMNGGQFSVVFAYPDARTRERSPFVPSTGTRYVRWEGRLLRVAFAEERPAEVVTYAVTTERVATSTAAFADLVLDAQGVVLDGLSAEQRDVVEQAIDGEYSACEPYSEAFRGLRDRLSIGEHEFASFVRYDGRGYVTELAEWVQ